MMYKNKRTLGVITARGGSKGIPGKNIKLFCGKPLIAWTIQAAQRSAYLTRCVVSTDDKQIASISRDLGAEVPFMRPAELAQDSTPAIPVIQQALHWLSEHEHEAFDYVMILQPTSPLRTADDIDACITKIVDADADSVMSMVELSDFAPVKLKRIENGVILPLFESEGKASAPRQQGAKVYKRNCAIYLTKTSLIMSSDLFGEISRPYIMPRERSVDINEPFDFALAEFFMGRGSES